MVDAGPGAPGVVAAARRVFYSDAIGAFVVCAARLTTVGLTGWFDTLISIPSGIAAALLAGILFEIGIKIFRVAEHRSALVIVMFLVYLVGKRFVPCYAIPATARRGPRGQLGSGTVRRWHELAYEANEDANDKADENGN